MALNLRTFLEGPYVSGGQMHGNLNDNGYLPLEEPYTNVGFTLDNALESISPSVLSGTTQNDDVVDWIVVQFRDKNDLTTTQYAYALLLQRDGDVVQYKPDNQTVSSGLRFAIPLDDYYVAIFHRNHLPLMTAAPVSLTNIESTLDFTSLGQAVYGTDVRKEVETGVFGHYAGDATGNNSIDAADRSSTWNNRNQSGYKLQDVTLNGSVDAADRSKTWNNRNRSGAIDR